MCCQLRNFGQSVQQHLEPFENRSTVTSLVEDGQIANGRPPQFGSSWSYDGQLGARDTCPVPVEVYTTAPKPNPFVALSQDEIDAVGTWLLSPAQGLNLTDTSNPNVSLSDNYIWHIDVLKPNKSDVLSYLDGNGTVPRYAQVALIQGGLQVHIVAEYSVGPLPISNNTQIQPLDWMYNGVNGAKVLFSAGWIDPVRRAAIDNLMTVTMSPIADLTIDLLDMAFYDPDDPRTNMTYFVPSPASSDGAKSIVWSPWRRAGIEPWDQPSDLYIQFDISGTDASLWKPLKVVYNLKVYDTVADFYVAWTAGSINKTPPPATDTRFLLKNQTGAVRDLEKRLAPTVLSLDGNRYRIDIQNQYVEYMGWSFYIRFDYDVGMQFYDIKFKGERILYELSLQGELPHAVAQYSGHNPFQSSTAHMDRFYGIGACSIRMIPGYDCPCQATYLNGTYSAAGVKSSYDDGASSLTGSQSFTQDNTMCIFETDIGVPITRHTDPTWAQSTKGSKLVVRMIATIGNYDYPWDYGFNVDGTISVDGHASGYVQANYCRPDDEDRWGPRIEQRIAGTLHMHVMNFKADFDLIDENNTFV